MVGRSNWIMAHPPDDRRPGLRPPQFRLRTLLAAIAVLCALLSLLTSLSAYGAFAAILFVLAVLAHLAGATLGHQLRDNGGHPQPAGQNKREPRWLVQEADFAPATKLSQRRRPGILILVLTVLGTAAGGTGGAIALLLLYRDRATAWSVGSGSCAFAVLGGIGAFVVASFALEVLSAMWEAQRGR
jgi:hypothetical protein